MNNFVATQWAANAAAKEGSFRSWLHKCVAKLSAATSQGSTDALPNAQHKSQQHALTLWLVRDLAQVGFERHVT